VYFLQEQETDMLSKKWTQHGEEPTLQDVMADPIVKMVMERDNLKENDVWQIVNKAKEQIEHTAA